MLLSIKQDNFLKKYFVLPGIIQWNNLNLHLTNSNCLNIFRNRILKFIIPSANSAFNSHNPKQIEFITRLRLVQSLLAERIFRHSFQDLLNPIFNCWFDIESIWLICYKKSGADSNLINILNKLPHKLPNKL